LLGEAESIITGVIDLRTHGFSNDDVG
jgi:hypothetical protein